MNSNNKITRPKKIQNISLNKDLKLAASLGKLLRKRRLSLKLSLDQVEKQIKIRTYYLKLIESGNYDKLSSDFYAKGFVKNYAEFLGFESKPILDMYKSERRAHNLHNKKDSSQKPKIGLKPLNSPRFIFTPKTLIAFSGLAFVILIIGYIIWQLTILASPPKLTINNPPTQDISTNSAFISGKAEGGADLFINDSPILSAPDGSFREKISLSEGVNLVKITAKNKLGKSVSVNRTINAKLPQTSVAKTTQQTNEKVDGVRVIVKISKQATWLIINADGKEIFRGTMLAGSTQAFEAAASLKITTGNADSTQLILSNLLILNKDLGIIGSDGEIKRDLEFKKDTLVQ
ncbi:MAG: DUF4115 domain-containing protein [bacterium]|nr:DUF4115 domain-containing protein [bacterium]